MKLQNKFEVPRDADETWRILLDVPRIVSCVPGAELTSAEPGGTYKGRIGVKLGPVALKFNGTVTFASVDDATRTAVVNAKGSDQQGRGNAGAVTTMKVTPAGDGAEVQLETDLQLSGMVAQYGRASGVIIAVSNEITTQFANALRQQLSAGTTAAAAPLPEGAATVAASAPPPPAQSLNLITILWRALLSKLGLRRAAQ